jgi:hypothetical protein
MSACTASVSASSSMHTGTTRSTPSVIATKSGGSRRACARNDVVAFSSGESGLSPRRGEICRCSPVEFRLGSDWSFVRRREAHRREESGAELGRRSCRLQPSEMSPTCPSQAQRRCWRRSRGPSLGGCGRRTISARSPRRTPVPCAARAARSTQNTALAASPRPRKRECRPGATQVFSTAGKSGLYPS